MEGTSCMGRTGAGNRACCVFTSQQACRAWNLHCRPGRWRPPCQTCCTRRRLAAAGRPPAASSRRLPVCVCPLRQLRGEAPGRILAAVAAGVQPEGPQVHRIVPAKVGRGGRAGRGRQAEDGWGARRAAQSMLHAANAVQTGSEVTIAVTKGLSFGCALPPNTLATHWGLTWAQSRGSGRRAGRTTQQAPHTRAGF